MNRITFCTKRRFERDRKRLVKFKRWTLLDWLFDNERDLKRYYKLGYQQALRDVTTGKVEGLKK